MTDTAGGKGRTERELEHKILELTALYEISKVLTESLDFSITCARVLKLLAQMTGMERGTFLVRAPGGRLSIVAAHGMTDEQIRKGEYRIGEGVVGNVLASGSPIVIPDIGDEPMFLDRTGARSRLQARDTIAFICVPVKVRGEVVGVLSADRVVTPDVSFERDVRFLAIVGGSIAQAVRINEMVQDEKQRLLDENMNLKAELKGRYRFDNIIGGSDRMQEVFGVVDRVSRSSATVLLRGESGTGKELIARAVHYNSPRAQGPFVKINCAALPETLLESELFGHDKGAFTGAVGEKRGRFEMAHGGTLFLDEIGDIPLPFQVKLLRVLQERQFERIGGTQTITVDVRLITATNRNLEEAVAKGEFREDLYYRLNVIPVFLPPLREREADVPQLIQFFLRRFNEANGKSVRLSRPVFERLLAYPWPGNVRELENVVEHMVVMARGEEIREEDLPRPLLSDVLPRAATGSGVSAGGALSTAAAGSRLSPFEEAERRLVVEALRRCGGVQAKAALQLGITARQIGYKIRKYGIRVTRE